MSHSEIGEGLIVLHPHRARSSRPSRQGLAYPSPPKRTQAADSETPQCGVVGYGSRWLLRQHQIVDLSRFVSSGFRDSVGLAGAGLYMPVLYQLPFEGSGGLVRGHRSGSRSRSGRPPPPPRAQEQQPASVAAAAPLALPLPAAPGLATPNRQRAASTTDAVARSRLPTAEIRGAMALCLLGLAVVTAG
eukprot:COSAG01_NODE_5646_length_4119_cov_7.726119_3_plen_189_part_00